MKYRKFDNASINHLYTELESINLYDFFDKDPNCDPNVNYEIFESKITELINKHIPQRKLKYNKYKYKKSNWITTRILKSIKYRDKLYKSMKKTPTYTYDFIIIKHNLSVYNKILKRLIREAKRQYYHNTFENYKKSSKNLEYHK